MKPTHLAAALCLAFSVSQPSWAAVVDYSDQTLDHGLEAIGEGNGISADNLVINGSSLFETPNRNEGVYIGAGASGEFGGEVFEVRFDTDDEAHEFAGVQVNGQETGDASAVFSADSTVIDVSGSVSSGKWGFGLLVNGLGENTASAKFTGGDVYISTTTDNYTAQSATVKANATLDFSNSGDVEIHAYSPFGVTVVDAPGDLIFNNAGDVLLKGEILPGTHTGQTNVVGIQGGGGNWTVTSEVNEFRIELEGAGVDNDGTSYSTGTKGMTMGRGTVSVNSQRFIIDMNIAEDVVDDSPEGHTAEEAYGIQIDSGVTFTVGADTDTTITVRDGLGVAYGVHAKADTNVTFQGDTVIETEGKTESVAVVADGGESSQSTSVTFGGSANRLTGDVVGANNGHVAFANGRTQFDGQATFDASSSLSLTEADLELNAGSTVSVAGTMSSDSGRIILHDAAENTVNVTTLAEGSTLQVTAASDLNDRLGGDLSTFSRAVSITNGVEGTELFMEEGLVAGETSGVLKADGTVDAGSVRTKTNSVMQSTLEVAANLPLMMNRILTNDVRKRMGDLRASKGDFGAWTRYDGGRLSGENGLDTDFHTVQVGFDVKPSTDSARLGVAFSYTMGDTDYARGTSDLDAYSLAGYGTWFAENGLFVDVVGRIATLKNDISVDSHHSGSMKNFLAGISAEAGWRLSVADNAWIEPQMEWSYAYVRDDSFDIGPASYRVDAVDSLTGRLGASAGISCPNGKGDFYVRASVVREFLGDARIDGRTTGSVGRYEFDGEDTWFEYGLGGNLRINDATYCWADVERTGGATIDEDWRATVGVRYAW